jgi:hypothetical protein
LFGIRGDRKELASPWPSPSQNQTFVWLCKPLNWLIMSAATDLKESAADPMTLNNPSIILLKRTRTDPASSGANF